MADLDQKLQDLAERGTPIGADELLERVRSELAGVPQIVASPRPFASRAAIERNRRWASIREFARSKPAAAIAALVVALALGGAGLLLNNPDTPTADGPEPAPGLVAPVEDMLAAFFKHDSSFVEFFADETYPQAIWDFTEWAFGLDVTGTYECSSDANGPVLCNVETTNELARLAGIPPRQTRLSFDVEDGKIVYATDIHFYLPTDAISGDWDILVGSYEIWLHETKSEIYASTFQEGCDFRSDQDCMYVFEGSFRSWTASQAIGEVMLDLAMEFLASEQWERTRSP